MATPDPYKPPRDAAYFAARSDVFRTKLLQAIGAPVTPNNLLVLQAWSAVETGWPENPRSGTTLWNPLNSTRPSGQAGETRYNTAGVRNYPTQAAGVQTLADTLNNYPGVVKGLQRNDPAAAVNAIVNSPWVTSSAAGAYGAPGKIGRRDYTRSTLWQIYQKLSNNAGAATRQTSDTTPVAFTATPAGIGDILTAPVKFWQILTSGDFWRRFAWIASGIAVLVLAAYLLFKQQTMSVLGKVGSGLGALTRKGKTA